jgi:hypothetical protein
MWEAAAKLDLQSRFDALLTTRPDAGRAEAGESGSRLRRASS